MSAEASEMWQSLRLPGGGRRKEESQEHLCAKGLGVLGTRWWWSHQPDSGTSCLPSRVRGDKLLGPSGPLLFSVTQGASAFCYPPEKGPQAVMSSLADVTAGQMDLSTLTLEGMCPKLAGEDMPAALPAQGCGRASRPARWLAEDLLPYGALVLGHVRAGNSKWKERKTVQGGRWCKEPYGRCSVSRHPQDSSNG